MCGIQREAIFFLLNILLTCNRPTVNVSILRTCKGEYPVVMISGPKIDKKINLHIYVGTLYVYSRVDESWSKVSRKWLLILFPGEEKEEKIVKIITLVKGGDCVVSRYLPEVLSIIMSSNPIGVFF